MTVSTRCLSLAALAGAASSLALAAPPVIEVSEDGLITVEVIPSPTDDTGWATESDAIPYPLVPDQQVNLRRQIGGLQIADIDDDGDNDVIAVCYISNSFPPYEEWQDMIFRNIGGQIETTPSWLANPETHTGDVQVGDVNKDGFLDIVTIHGGSLRSDNVRIYFGAAGGPPVNAGYVSVTPQNSWGTSGVLVDLDNDNDLDLVTTNQGLGQNDPYRPMYQFENLNGTMATSPSWQSAEQSIQNGAFAADVNNDGWMDVSVSKWVNFRSAIYHNTGSGSLETVPGWERPDLGGGDDGLDTDRGTALGDLDGNGTVDIAIGGDPATWWSNDGDSFTQVWQAQTPFQGPQDFKLFDVDQDGDLDVAEIHFGDGKAHIYLNRNGVIDTLPAWTYDASQVGTALAFGDINGDGWADLVTGYSGDTSIRVFYAIPLTCDADLTGSSDPNDPSYAQPDGDADADDFFFYLDAFVAQDLGTCDFTGSSDPNDPTYGNPDNDCDADDFFFYLDLFVAGCP
ncbi:MAG: FG-GAP-like repeat-containing protein [Phycisphaerales bacterium JB037]